MKVAHIVGITDYVFGFMGFQVTVDLDCVFRHLLWIAPIELVDLINLLSDVQLSDFFKLLDLLCFHKLISIVNSMSLLCLATSLRLGSTPEGVEVGLEVGVETHDCVPLN